jgi:hypothetical protein
LFVHRGARNEQKLNNITGNKPEADFPNDGVTFHLVTSTEWNKVLI